MAPPLGLRLSPHWNGQMTVFLRQTLVISRTETCHGKGACCTDPVRERMAYRMGMSVREFVPRETVGRAWLHFRRPNQPITHSPFCQARLGVWLDTSLPAGEVACRGRHGRQRRLASLS